MSLAFTRSFRLTFVGFYVAGSTLGENDIVNRCYYVWLSVFSLYHLSVFWTFMSGLYNKEQAKRLFSIIAMGASAWRDRRAGYPDLLCRQHW